MSDVISKAVELLGKKVPSFDGVCKFVMPGEGSIMMDVNGVRAGDEEADVTMTAKAEVFMWLRRSSRENQLHKLCRNFSE